MHRIHRDTLRYLLVAVLSLFTIGVPVGVAGAHTDFDFSLPTDGAAVGEVVHEVTVAFTEPVTLVGNGFEVLDPQGNILQPFAVTDDDQVFRLQFDPPLAGGQVGVRYEVTSVDGHVVDGGFQFTVSADPPAATTPSTTAAPSTVAPTTETPAAVAPITPVPTTDVDVVEAVGTESSLAASTSESQTTGPPTDDSSSNGVYVAIAMATALAAGVFLILRARSTR